MKKLLLILFCLPILAMAQNGCTDPTACNFDTLATIDDGSCLTDYGCMDAAACNYDSTATCNDGSCNFPDGCMDATACNYDPASTCDDGSCILPDGCTDATACNYDVLATCDDGSCILPDGCTDTAAFNYNALATCDDGSCIPVAMGCMDTLACNYDASANTDDGSCLTAYGCTDATACNYDAAATCDDNSCYTLIVSIDQNGEELMANITNATGAATTNWYNVQGESTWLMKSDATSFTPTYDCSYFIISEDENCSVQSDTYVYGANAARIGSLITSPNPTSGLINVKFDNTKNQIVKLDLINSTGTKLDQFITSDNELNIDLSKYPSGNYYINFDSSDNLQGCVEEKRQVITNKIILNK